MVRLSNTLVGLLNLITFLLSIPILGAGIWLRNHGNSLCEKFLEMPIIVLGVFLMLVSLAGLIGACCRVSWLLGLYLLVMFLLIVILFAFTIFAFVVTNKGAGNAISGKGFKQYKLGDYSNWLQKRVNNNKNWSKIKSCLIAGNVCSYFRQKYLHDTVTQLHSEHLSAIQSGCCKPSGECGFTYKSPTEWTAPANATSSNPDCSAWGNDPKVLCFYCQSCKAGVVDNLKSNWKKVAVINIVVLIFLIIVYSIGCCAFRNNRRDNAYWKS